MEQQKEKKIKSCGRRKSSSMSKSNSSFPPDLVSEILQKLPPKSVARSRCVSKLWSSITMDPYFNNSFENRPSTKPSLLLLLKKSKKTFVFSVPQNNESSQHVERYQLKYPKPFCFSTLQSVHGLICFELISGISTSFVIWNPTIMRQFLILPKPETSWMMRTTLFLGYDPMERKHKVVCMPNEELCDECWVLTLGSSTGQESLWKRIRTNLFHKPFCAIHDKGVCINGVLYYKAFDRRNNKVVVSFDVRSEKFQLITALLETCSLRSPITYEGRLAFVGSEYQGNAINLCILEDAEKQEWSHKSFSVPFRYYKSCCFKLSGVNDGGEFVYIQSKIYESFCILYFDPKRDSFRIVEFAGLADDEFRLSNEVGYDHIYEVHAFPNHIESLISMGSNVDVDKPNQCLFETAQSDKKLTWPQGRYQKLVKSYSSRDLEGILGKSTEESSPAVCDLTDTMEIEDVSEDKGNCISVANPSPAVKRKRGEIIQEPKIKLKELCKQILKKDGGSMKLKQLRSLINGQAPSLLSERKDAIAYLKLKLEHSGKFVVEGKKISLISRKK